MLVRLFTSFLLIPGLELAGRRQNSIDKHLTSLSTQSEASRVQNVVQYLKDSRPGLAHNSASMFSRQDSESIGSSSRQDFKTIESSSRQHRPSDSNSGHSQTQRRREGR